MKKLATFLIALAFVSVLAACNGDDEYAYNPGLYLGYTENGDTTLAYVYVDADGDIADVLIDTASEKDVDDDETVAATKRAYNGGEGYEMSPDSDYLWVEQVDMLADEVVENNGIPELDLDEEGDIEGDTLAGVTISVDGYLEAIEDALAQAELGEDEVPADVADVDGDYDAGIQYGSVLDDDYTYAVAAVNEAGGIEHIMFDVGYEIDDDVFGTKRALDGGYGYEMSGSGDYLWVEQVDMLAEDIVENQSYDYELDNGDIDAIAGVSITVDAYLDALADALE